MKICPGCGKEIGAVDARFCPYCASQLVFDGADSMFDELRALYTEYIAWSAEYYAQRSGLLLFSDMFTGGADYKKREEHGRFYERCAALAKDLAASMGAPGADRSLLVPMLRFVLIDCHENCDDWGEWMLLAAEKNFMPLVEMLSGAEAKELYEPYRKLRRKNRGLPPQDELLKKLKKLRA
ncbi:MAG: hypothetical protein IJV74_04245 [Clostridia bacterium]|nr:hypothetical protein [Clostridia bacterium]